MTIEAQVTRTSGVASGRDLGLDAARSSGILLVVLGHALIRSLDIVAPGAPDGVLLSGIGTVRMTPFADIALTLIYSFHMPLLAYVSGHAFSRSSVGYGARFIARRASGLLIPYLAWLLVAWVLAGDLRLAALGSFVGSAILDPQSPGGLWFLYALFGSATLLAAGMRLGGSDRTLIASALLAGVLGVLPLGAYGNLFGLSDIAWLYPFVVAGVLAARHRTALEHATWLTPLSMALWVASLPLVWPVLVPGPRWWAADVAALAGVLGPAATLVPKALWALIRVIGALAGTYAVFQLAGRLRGRSLAVAAWLGRRTLGIYATHGHVLLYVAPLVASFAAPVRTVALFATGMTAAVILTLALETMPVTRRVFLGTRSPG